MLFTSDADTHAHKNRARRVLVAFKRANIRFLAPMIAQLLVPDARVLSAWCLVAGGAWRLVAVAGDSAGAGAGAGAVVLVAGGAPKLRLSSTNRQERTAPKSPHYASSDPRLSV
jgi:hypothetical protein